MSNSITLETARTADERAAVVKANLAKVQDQKIPLSSVGTDKPIGEGLLSANRIRETILQDFKATVRLADSLRTGSQDRKSINFDLEHIARQRFGFASANDMFHALGIEIGRAHV